MEYICDIYVRLSHEEKESDSIENQIKIAEEYIKERDNFFLNEIRIDEGYSGVDFNRPAFMKMMEDIKEGNINCIIVKDLSRLGRNYIDVGRYIENIFPMYNVRFISINDRIDTKDENYRGNDIIIPFKNLINEFYVRDISIKTKSSLRAKMKRGEVIAAFPPYGYKKEKNRLIIDDEPAQIIRWIFEMYMKGYGCGNIAQRLNFADIKSPYLYKREKYESYKSGFAEEKTYWHYNTIRKILKNEVYCGKVIQGKRKRISYKVRKNVIVKKENQIDGGKQHEEIIDENDFLIVNKILEEDSRCAGGRKKVYPLSGIIYCGECGEKFIKKTVGKYKYYICGRYKRGEGCGDGKLKEEEIMKGILGLIAITGKKKERESSFIEIKIAERRKRAEEIKNEEVKEYCNKIFGNDEENEMIDREEILRSIKKIYVFGGKRCEVYMRAEKYSRVT